MSACDVDGAAMRAARDVCQLPAERGECDQKRGRYFYNAAESRCENFGACAVEGGDVNNFATKDECLVRCQFSLKNGGVIVATAGTPLVRVGNAATLPIAVSPERQNVCRMPLDRGNCGRKRARLYYHTVWQTVGF